MLPKIAFLLIPILCSIPSLTLAQSIEDSTDNHVPEVYILWEPDASACNDAGGYLDGYTCTVPDKEPFNVPAKPAGINPTKVEMQIPTNPTEQDISPALDQMMVLFSDAKLRLNVYENVRGSADALLKAYIEAHPDNYNEIVEGMNQYGLSMPEDPNTPSNPLPLDIIPNNP